MLLLVSERMLTSGAIVASAALFVLAGALEIGGGWLVWRALRGGAPLSWGILGALGLVAYGCVPPLQPSRFGRVYAAYGGIFIALSLLWGWLADGDRPDTCDLAGALLCLAGAAVMMYWPRAAMSP